MLVRLLYVSRVATSVDADALAAILRHSRSNNATRGITGVLCHCAKAALFVQMLEGGRTAVNALYNAISRDERHHDVTLLDYDEVAERRFASWQMGQVNLDRLNPGVVLKYSEGPTLDPYRLSGAATRAMFEELVATASIGSPG